MLPFVTISQDTRFAIVLHGGAGYITPTSLDKTKQTQYKESLLAALDIGTDILSKGGSSDEAVIAVIQYMENDTLFNAGRGAVLTHDKKISHDASIMYGKDLSAGAITGTSRIKNPILGAVAVKKFSDHVFLSGDGAEYFAKTCGLEMVDPSFFITNSRMSQIEKLLKNEKKSDGHHSNPSTIGGEHGTVGCVALDKFGNITAGTSTGGMTDKKYGRIGDSPIIGAGTYADNQTCGVSCTGYGEYFIRVGVAKEISAQMRFGYLSLQDAANYTVYHHLSSIGGDGGIIAIDKSGNIVIEFNTSGMFRAWQNEGEDRQVGLFKSLIKK